MAENFSIKSITPEEFEGKIVPSLNTIGELIMSHPDIPEDVDQAELLGSISTLTTEMRNTVNERVPETVALQETLAKKDKQIQKLQDTNQQLFLKVGKYSDPAKKTDENAPPPKKSFDEIRQMIDKL